MRSPLNKSMRPQDKGPEPAQAAPIINPDLQSVMDLTARIKQAIPGDIEGIQMGLAQARAAEEQAAETKANAETEEEFDKACDDAVRARVKKEFFLRLLDYS